MNKMSEIKVNLWKLADAELKKIGGVSAILRNRDKSVRDAASVEGSREWALVESSKVSSPAWDDLMNDEYCQKLINILNK